MATLYYGAVDYYPDGDWNNAANWFTYVGYSGKSSAPSIPAGRVPVNGNDTIDIWCGSIVIPYSGTWTTAVSIGSSHVPICEINAGTYSGPISSYGTLNGGTFLGTVTVLNITGGTFFNKVTCSSITGGNFSSCPGIYCSIINAPAVTFACKVFDVLRIDSGTFNDHVYFKGNSAAPLITDGTFGSKVMGNSYTLTIKGGTFNGPVYGDLNILGGTFTGITTIGAPNIAVSTDFATSWTVLKNPQILISTYGVVFKTNSNSDFVLMLGKDQSLAYTSDFFATLSAKSSSSIFASEVQYKLSQNTVIFGNGQTQYSLGFFSGIYKTTDNWDTYTTIVTPNIWQAGGLAVSADGTKMVIAGNSGGVYTSTNSGANWTKRGTTKPEYMASSWDVSILFSIYAYKIYRSADSGVTWTAASLTIYPEIICCSSTAQYGIALTSSANVYRTTNYGVTWSLTTITSIVSIDMSSNGQHMIALDSNGVLWVSTDYGANWVASYTVPVHTSRIMLSPDGNKIYAFRTTTPSDSTVMAGTFSNDVVFGCCNIFGGVFNKKISKFKGGHVVTMGGTYAPAVKTDVTIANGTITGLPDDFGFKAIDGYTENVNIIGGSSDILQTGLL